jgi:uncharacterized protein
MVMRHRASLVLLFALVLFLTVPLGIGTSLAAVGQEKKLIYDEAELLSLGEYNELNALANELGAKRQTDIIIYTSKNAANADVLKMTQNFYDEKGPGYDKAHGNAVILTVDMRNREVYLAGFYKAEDYLDDGRLNKIRSKLSPAMTKGDYKAAFKTYIQTSYKYMGYRPGVNPDNILFNIWFQLAVSLGIGAGVVGIMAYHSGGRVTVHRQTYENAATSGILENRDQYIRTTLTKRKIPKNNGGGSSGGGGGGRTGGGHSHSGSRGSF